MLDNSCSLSLSSYNRCPSLLIISMALHWTHSSMSFSMCPSYWGAQNRTQHSRTGVTTIEWRGIITSRGSLDAGGLLFCKYTLLAYVHRCVYQDPYVLFCQAVSQPDGLYPVLMHGIIAFQEQKFAFPFIEPHEVLLAYFSSLSRSCE